jgi:hypothetical protein
MDGIEHTSTVSASSLYEAVARGIASLRQHEWIDRLTLEAGSVTVTPGDAPVEHRIELREFNAWVERRGATSPRDTIRRANVREILGLK